MSEIIQILQSHSPRNRDVQVIFFKVSLKFEMAATDYFFCGRKNSKLKIIQISLSHSSPYGDVQVIFQAVTEIQNGLQESTSIFCGRKNSKIPKKYEIILQSHYPPHAVDFTKIF